MPEKQEVAIRSFIRVNHKIRVPRVRCIDTDGEMLGIIPTRDARQLAMDKKLDLVEVSPNADPPVCRIMDYGKFRYDEGLKQKEARKRAHKNVLKEVKFHANVAEHDYQTKLSHIRKFLDKGHKVRISLQFRGRENAHRELGFQVIARVIKECEDVSHVDMQPRLMGRNVVAMLGVNSAKS